MASIDGGSPALTIVLGMHRSGTSLCAHALSLLGLDMADEISPHESNPRGHWERWEIVKLHDRVFQHFGQDYYDLKHAQPLPPGWWADPAVRKTRDEITDWLGGRMKFSRRFGVKDPRISRLMPMWREILIDLEVQPRFVFCIRPPDAVASSLAARDKLVEAEGEYRWLVYNAGAIDGLGAAAVTTLPYDRWFTDPLVNLRLLDTAVDGRRDELFLLRVIESVFDPTLRHHFSNRFSHSSGLGARLYRMLLDCPASGPFTPELRMAAAAFEGLAGVIGPLRQEVLRLAGVDAALETARAEQLALAQALDAAQTLLTDTIAKLEIERGNAERLLAERDEARAALAPGLDPGAGAIGDAPSSDEIVVLDPEKREADSEAAGANKVIDDNVPAGPEAAGPPEGAEAAGTSSPAAD
jgi:hypothetical protein